MEVDPLALIVNLGSSTTGSFIVITTDGLIQPLAFLTLTLYVPGNTEVNTPVLLKKLAPSIL